MINRALPCKAQFNLWHRVLLFEALFFVPLFFQAAFFQAAFF